MSKEIKDKITKMGSDALTASRALANLTTDQKNKILLAMADGILSDADQIISANAIDLDNAVNNNLTNSMIDRLRLDQKRIEAIADGIRQVATLPDPVGEIMDEWERPNGIKIKQIRVPIGIIGIIYESRPNVTSDAAVLCLKTGNATILRGGKESINSNIAISDSLQNAGEKAGLPENSIQLIPFTDRESVKHLAEMDEYLDLIIPRGGAGLIEAVVSMARMPVIKHYDGICHTYVDSECDLEMASNVVMDAKTQKPSVCNALETLLVSEQIADTFLPTIGKLLSEQQVEIRADDLSRNLLGVDSVEVKPDDWKTEYLDLIVSIKVVSDVNEAIDHINHYGSHHSDCIITESETNANQFMNNVDSATVFWNVSTRFSDGEEFGFGAEIGISTDKLHARGPMALRELTSYKYLISGKGQTKA
ncbi:MAG: glutamate-5-semialdehyde dehydrogenase [Verrucomicrobiota bacterium]|jgi:glutamate-5-semialdehyde dehydrogenase|nr:glutamate-5-semialdehyde dehydrogenase [Verrucomicrobiales bacterium]MED5260763.1 glutamate-5-semialdehyde dehydrogenase [Verrucomicrobiota bacterium]MED5457070.1 glutamate-5-semialdehyde dehydrogenase [Verrucomicrobiota bacterium]|tara:strand:+ start:1201 stop:2466 length:1266 start_codon:yes stop_codon:yes gene_type:complete